jgi:hypothetical protein
MAKQRMRIRIAGSGVSPETVKASDLAEFITEIEKAIQEAAIGHDLPSAEALVSLVEITEGSDELTLAIADPVLSGPKSISKAIAEKQFANLPQYAWEALSKISKKAKERKWTIEFLPSPIMAVEHAIISPENGVPDPAPPPIARGTTTVYGRLLRVGGVKPKAELRIRDGVEALYLDIDESMAKQLAPRLYEEVGMEGEATWNTITWRIVAFKATRILDFQPSALTEAFRELAEASGGRWHGIKADEYISELRGNGQ